MRLRNANTIIATVNAEVMASASSPVVRVVMNVCGQSGGIRMSAAICPGDVRAAIPSVHGAASVTMANANMTVSIGSIGLAGER